MIDLERLIADAVSAELDKRGVKAANDQSDYLTVADYARRWSVSPSTVRQAIRDKRLPCTRVGRLVRIAADAKIARATKARFAERADLVLLRGSK